MRVDLRVSKRLKNDEFLFARNFSSPVSLCSCNAVNANWIPFLPQILAAQNTARAPILPPVYATSLFAFVHSILCSTFGEVFWSSSLAVRSFVFRGTPVCRGALAGDEKLLKRYESGILCLRAAGLKTNMCRMLAGQRVREWKTIPWNSYFFRQTVEIVCDTFGNYYVQ